MFDCAGTVEKKVPFAPHCPIRTDKLTDLRQLILLTECGSKQRPRHTAGNRTREVATN